MAKFNGNNRMTSVIGAFSEKVNFKLNAYNANYINLKDMSFVENVLYGRVDTNLNTVIPNTQFMKPIYSEIQTSQTNVAMNFVSDAFKDLSDLFKQKLILGHIPQDELYLTTPVLNQAYVDPVEKYREYIRGLFSIYVNDYLGDKKTADLIMNINDFVDHFFNYIKVLTSQLPITFTSWHRSNLSTPFASGLVLNIAAYNHDLDNFKYENIINTKTFEFYVNACRNCGFNVSKENPSVIFADIESAAMIPYLENYNLTTAASVFANQFESVFDLDINFLDNLFVTYYNGFVSENPYKRTQKYCNLKNRIKSELMYRNNININLYNNIINNKRKILLYLNIRNHEEGDLFAKPDLKRIEKRAFFLLNKLDISSAISYINEQFRSTFKSKSGGINWLNNWLKQRDRYEQAED